MILHDEINALVVLYLNKVDHITWVLVQHPQVPLAVSDDGQPFLGQNTGVLHSVFVLTELLGVRVQVEHLQLPAVADHAALAAGAVNAHVQARVFAGVYEAVDVRVVGLDVFHGRAFVHLVVFVLAGINFSNVELLDLPVVAHNE